MNWLNPFKRVPDTFTSLLYDERTFYQAFMKDLQKCEKEVIIESPFITSSRMEMLYPLFKRLVDRGITIHIVTKDPIEHDEDFRHQSTNEILSAAELGVHVVMLKGNHHRKLAIIDRKILWEGSLNILSHCNSLEIMRRIEYRECAEQMFDYLNLQKLIY